MMNSDWRDWLAAIAFFAAFGWAGNGDYEYRQHQAQKELASKEVKNDSNAKHRIGSR